MKIIRSILYEPESPEARDRPRKVGDARPLRPTRIQAIAESAIAMVEGTKASSMPPVTKPSGDPPMSSVERAPNTLPKPIRLRVVTHFIKRPFGLLIGGRNVLVILTPVR
jgi:hypothetical protein